MQEAPNFLFDKTSTFCVCVSPGYFCSESHPHCKTSNSSVTKTFGTTHVMVSALGSFQTLRIQWFERRSRPAVFARRKPHFERHRLLRHDEHRVFLNAVSFRSINLLHSAQNNAQSTIFVVFLRCEFLPERQNHYVCSAKRVFHHLLHCSCARSTYFVVRNQMTYVSMRLFLCRSISHDKTSTSSVRANC